MQLLAELALIGRGRRPPDPTPNLTSDSDPPPPRGSSQNRVAPHRIVVYAWLMGAPREASGPPLNLPPTRKKAGPGGTGPAQRAWGGGSLWHPEGAWVQLRGWGAKRGVAMSHDIL